MTAWAGGEASSSCHLAGRCGSAAMSDKLNVSQDGHVLFLLSCEVGETLQRGDVVSGSGLAPSLCEE